MYEDNSDALKDALLKWIVQSGELAQRVWAKQFLASNPAENPLRQQVSDATKFGLQELYL
jgi:hypothetical protein